MGELILILVLLLLLFGANRLPKAGAGLGKAVRNFKDALAGNGEGRPGNAGREGREGGPGGGTKR